MTLRLDSLPSIGPAVVTLGVFDGVHLGHRRVLEETVRLAAEHEAASVALVFTPHPDEVIRPGSRVKRLLPPEETLARIASVGIDNPMEIAFDDALRAMTPEDFLAQLAPALDVRGVVMGAESAFGRARAGTPERVSEIGAARGFGVATVDRLLVEGEPVSSTRVRRAVSAGDLELARRLTGHPPMLRGRVVPGDRRGRTLGFPTANLAFAYTAALPALGIYLGRVSVPERGVGPDHPALVSVGVRPTFHAHGGVLVEAYLLDWEGDLYDAMLDVHLAARLRDERRFESVDELIAQMRSDEAAARQIIGGTSTRGG